MACGEECAEETSQIVSRGEVNVSERVEGVGDERDIILS